MRNEAWDKFGARFCYLEACIISPSNLKGSINSEKDSSATQCFTLPYWSGFLFAGRQYIAWQFHDGRSAMGDQRRSHHARGGRRLHLDASSQIIFMERK